MTQHINGLLATLCILTLHGCQDGASQIRGGQSEYLPGGSLTTLALVAPDDEFVVAVVYPERWDMGSFEGLASGTATGNDTRQWNEDYKLRLQDGAKPEDVRITWEYSTRTRILTIAATRFQVPKGKMAVITLDAALKPACELRDNVPAFVEELRKALGAADTESQPTQPVRDIAAPDPQ